jgi:hypothetical protein
MRSVARVIGRRLPATLAKYWGRSAYYTPLQVRRALQMTGLEGKYDFLAMAAFLTREDYLICTVPGVWLDYDAARRMFTTGSGMLAGTYAYGPVWNDPMGGGDGD